MPKKVEREKVEIAIADYIGEHGVTSTREIAEGVTETLGYSPSTATVAEVLRALGYTPKDAPKAWWGK